MKIFQETMKSEDDSVQTEEEIPEEGLNMKSYNFFDRLSRNRNFWSQSIGPNI
jgi:hypothetical protein